MIKTGENMIITNNIMKNKLIESNFLEKNAEFNLNILKELLIKKFNKIDYGEAKEDVIPFIKDVNSLNIWNKDFFISITENLK